MTKRQIIDNIIDTNPTAEPGFLAQFEQVDLLDYLRKLDRLSAPRLAGASHWRPQAIATPVVNAEVLVAASACPAATDGQEYQTLHHSRSLTDMVDPFQEPVADPETLVEVEEVELGVYEPVTALEYDDDLDLNVHEVVAPEPAADMVLVGGPNDDQESWLF